MGHPTAHEEHYAVEQHAVTTSGCCSLIGGGELANAQASPPPQSGASGSAGGPGTQAASELGVDFTIPLATRHAIISHEFVDLATLLIPADSEEPATFQLVDGRLRPQRTVRAIQSFAAWTTAFLRFAGVYLESHPSDASGIIKHMQQVSLLNVPGLGAA